MYIIPIATLVAALKQYIPLDTKYFKWDIIFPTRYYISNKILYFKWDIMFPMRYYFPNEILFFQWDIIFPMRYIFPNKIICGESQKTFFTFWHDFAWCKCTFWHVLNHHGGRMTRNIQFYGTVHVPYYFASNFNFFASYWNIFLWARRMW